MNDNTNNPQDAQPIYQRIQRKHEILARIESIRLELVTQTRHKERLEIERSDARNRAAGFSEERMEKYPEERDKKLAYDNKAAKLLSEIESISRTIDALKAERQGLEVIELPACIQDTGIAEVLAHQDRTKALRADATRLQEAIAAQREVIAKANANIVKLPNRSSERAEILADIAIGEAQQSDLEKLDAQVATEQLEYENSRAIATPIIDHATQTITGLESKLADLTGKISAQEGKNTAVMEQYLMSEIKLVGSEYATHAAALRDAFIKLAGLENLFNRVTSTRRQIIPFTLRIPLPKLDECKCFTPYGQPDLIFTAETIQGNQERDAAAASERSRLVSAGCEIL